MKIDIISYTEEQFAGLTEKQLQEIREVQAEKDLLFAKLDKDRRDKGCEYAVLVSLLEPENDFYNELKRGDLKVVKTEVPL